MIAHSPVIVITPDMVVGNHDWHDINYWQWPLWRCQRCQMQTKQLPAADARPCLPTKKGQCRVCHEPGYSKTSLYCRRHENQAWNPNRRAHCLTDEEILDLKRQGVTLKEIGTKLGVSAARAGQIMRNIEYDRRRRQVRDLEDRLGPCACGDRRIWITDRHKHRADYAICHGCNAVRLESPEA